MLIRHILASVCTAALSPHLRIDPWIFVEGAKGSCTQGNSEVSFACSLCLFALLRRVNLNYRFRAVAKELLRTIFFDKLF